MVLHLPTKRESPLLALPTELLVVVFSYSASFSNVANLAASCKRLNKIWKEHTSYICNHVASATIPCYEDLRSLLADQGYLAMDAQVLKVSDAARLLATFKNIDELVTSYHDRVRKYRHWDPQVSRILSPAEKIRFIRAHYQLWGLMLLNDTQQQERIESMDLEQTCLLSDFLCIFDPWGIQDRVIQQVVEDNPTVHRQLQQKLRRQRNKDFLEQHSHVYQPVNFMPYESNGRYAWWCDRQQEIFQRMVTGSLFRKHQHHHAEEEEEEGEEDENEDISVENSPVEDSS